MSGKILIVAGDPSADIYCADLVKVLYEEYQGISIYAFGGKRLEASGVKFLYNLVDEAVIGLYEALKKWFKFKKILKDVIVFLEKEKPRVVLLADFYGLNINVAVAAKRLKIPVVYYISPKVWAWRMSRVKRIKRFVDRMLVIFPFEEELYRKENVNVSFVGNPLLDRIKPEGDKGSILDELGFDEKLPVIGLMPGSRRQEIDSLLPVIIESARAISEKHRVQFAVILEGKDSVDYVKDNFDFTGLDCRLVEDGDYRLRSAMAFSIVASGTATLENALLGMPMIIIYRISGLSYAIGKRIVKVEHVGLPNIVAGRDVVPEYLQDEATVDNIAGKAIEWLKNPLIVKNIRGELLQVRDMLGTPGVNRRVAAILGEYINA